MTTTPPTPPSGADAHAESLRELLETLIARAAERPAHARFLELLLAAETEDARNDIEPPRGVSGRVADALLDDVDWIRYEQTAGPVPAGGPFRSTYPNAYAARRLIDARAAADRRRTEAGPSGTGLEARIGRILGGGR